MKMIIFQVPDMQPHAHYGASEKVNTGGRLRKYSESLISSYVASSVAR